MTKAEYLVYYRNLYASYTEFDRIYLCTYRFSKYSTNKGRGGHETQERYYWRWKAKIKDELERIEKILLNDTL